MSTTDLYRKIHAIRPDIVEQVISLWGKPAFGNYIEGLFRSAFETGVALPADLAEAINGLVEEHRKEFPKIEVTTQIKVNEALEGNPDFQTIDGRFPHIGRRIRASWGTPAFADYMNGLFNDTRSGARQGFPPEILFALFKVQGVHEQEFPQYKPRISDIWSVGGEHA